MDDLRPRGTVEVTCAECGWSFWLDCLDSRLCSPAREPDCSVRRDDSRLPDGPFVCPVCDGTDEYIPKALDDDRATS
jgi:hypothetical protein